MENEIAAKFPPKCSIKSTEQKAKAASPVLRHWKLKPPSHPNAPFCGAFARLFNKQDCRQSYYRESYYEKHVRSQNRGFSPGDTGG
jgi:hypothetical protein